MPPLVESSAGGERELASTRQLSVGRAASPVGCHNLGHRTALEGCSATVDGGWCLLERG